MQRRQESFLHQNMPANSYCIPSYPPFFRPHPDVDSGPRPSSPAPQQPAEPPPSIPVIDFQDPDPVKLGEACREWGIFRVVNHGVPADLLANLLDLAATIFSISFESKQAWPTKPILYFWGSPALTMSGTAQQTGPPLEKLNWLEGLNVPLAQASQFCYQNNPLMESFRSLLVEYGRYQTRVAQGLFNTMVEHLNIPPAKSSSYLSPMTGCLRVYRYLRCPGAVQRLGIMEHTDSSVLSILHQDQVGGLQVRKDGKWIDIEPIRDTLIVNLGDMMQAMSNDRYVSVEHRVRVKGEKERISMGYFVFPAEDAVIESPKYRPFTYADFQAKKEVDLKTVGNKIGLPRFRITEQV